MIATFPPKNLFMSFLPKPKLYLNLGRKFGLVLAEVPWLLSLVVDAYAKVELLRFYLGLSVAEISWYLKCSIKEQ